MIALAPRQNRCSRLLAAFGKRIQILIRGAAETTCSQMTISKILSLGHCRPHLGHRSGSRGTGGSFSSRITGGCCHQSRQTLHGAFPTVFSSFCRRLLNARSQKRRGPTGDSSALCSTELAREDLRANVGDCAIIRRALGTEPGPMDRTKRF